MAVKRQIDKTFQGERESITIFMPRLLRLIQLIEPLKPEDELVEAVKEKLRATYLEKLAMHTIFTLDELNNLCLKVEAGLAAAQAASKRERNLPADDKRRKKKSEDKSSNDDKKSDRKPIICHRCDRKGHIAPKCKATSKKDGSPCNEKPNKKTFDKSKKQPFAAVQEKKDEPQQHVRKSEPSSSTSVSTIRAAGTHHLCSISTPTQFLVVAR